MPRMTIGLGLLLVALGVIAYIATAFASWTALIPAFLGVVIAIAGAIGLKRPKAGLAIALVIAVLGVLGTAMNVVELGSLFAGEAERPAAVITSTITFVLLIVYLVLGGRSFVAGRRAGEADTIA